MNTRFPLYLIIALFSASIGAVLDFYLNNHETQISGRVVPNFALLDHKGKFHKLYDYATSKAIILQTVASNCSSTKKVITQLNALQKQHVGNNIKIFLINTAPNEATDNLVAKLADSDIPLLMDDSQLVLESLGITRTGEAVVINPQTWSIRYRGPIDNGIDTQSEQPKNNRQYLRNAINSVINDTSLKAFEHFTVGCPINYIGNRATQAAISYSDDLAPILQKKCVQCHQKGGIGPWAMEEYANIKTWSENIRNAIMMKTMPPWHADPAVGQFSHSRALSIEEQQTLIHWIDSGSPRGDKPDPLLNTKKESIAEWPLGKPDLIIKVPSFKIPATGRLAYQYARFPVPVSEDTWVRAVHMKPSNRAATHHIFAFVEYPETLKHQQPVWAEGANGYFAAYVPGYPIFPFPDNSGRFLPKGSEIVFQRHYLTLGYPSEDNLELGLYFHKSPPEMEYSIATAINMKLKIPAHAASHKETAEIIIQKPAQIHAIYPHMHYRGKSIRFTAHTPDGNQQPLLSVPNYNFHWQTSYQLAQPQSVPVGTKISVEAIFDNSILNPANPDPGKAVGWGPLSDNEMLVGYIMMTSKIEGADKKVSERLGQ